MTAEEVIVEYNNDTGPNDEGFWEWWSVLRGQRVIAKCDTEAEANTIAALLRFQAAMTPEMWNALDDASANIPADFRHKLTDLVGARKALDTLRQELQQP